MKKWGITYKKVNLKEFCNFATFFLNICAKFKLKNASYFKLKKNAPNLRMVKKSNFVREKNLVP